MDFEMYESRTLRIAGVLLIVWSFFLALRLLGLTDVIWGPPVCCPFCAPMRWVDARLFIINPLLGMAYFPFGVLLFSLGAVLALVAGIAGLANWRRPKGANLCFLLGIAAVSVYLFILVIMSVAGILAFADYWPISTALLRGNGLLRIGALAVYGFYLAGAYQSKKHGAIHETN